MSDFLRESRLNDALHPPDGAHKQSSVFSNRRRSYSIASDLLCYEVWSLAGHLRHNWDCSKIHHQFTQRGIRELLYMKLRRKYLISTVFSFLLSTYKASHNNFSYKNQLATFVTTYPHFWGLPDVIRKYQFPNGKSRLLILLLVFVLANVSILWSLIFGHSSLPMYTAATTVKQNSRGKKCSPTTLCHTKISQAYQGANKAIMF